MNFFLKWKKKINPPKIFLKKKKFLNLGGGGGNV